MPRDTKNLIPYKPGQSGNPGGKTSAHRKAEVAAAEKAAIVQGIFVDALHNAVVATDGDLEKLALLTKEVNALIKNAQDRAFGAPVQPVDNTSSDGSARIPSVIQISAASAPKDN